MISHDELRGLLQAVAQQEVDCCCLMQLDLLYGDVKMIAFALIGTRIWHRLASFTSQSPDSFDLDTLRYCVAQSTQLSERETDPPDNYSPWHHFYLPPDTRQMVETYLDALLRKALHPELSYRRRRF
jgi:hypothetical protein